MTVYNRGIESRKIKVAWIHGNTISLWLPIRTLFKFYGTKLLQNCYKIK